MLQAMLIVLLVLMSLAGCGSAYDECLAQERKEYRDRNPQASYGQVAARQDDFERSCSNLKGK
jgi:hypothetical protein